MFIVSKYLDNKFTKLSWIKLYFGMNYTIQGGDRLGGETSGSERKGVMQWTGSELKSKRKLRVIWGFGGTERGIFYPCIVVVYNLKMFWSR